MKKIKICGMGTGSFIIYIKTEDIYVDIAKDIEMGSHTLSNELHRPLPKGKTSETKISERSGLVKEELSEKTAEFSTLKTKTCGYLNGNSDENKKKTKDTEKGVVNLKIINIVQKQLNLKTKENQI